MTALPQEKAQEKPSYTIKDIENLPEGVRAELIDGQIYCFASPTFMHQLLSGALYATIYNYIQSKGGPCKVVSAPFDVYLKKDDKTCVQPDISVICDTSSIDDKGKCNGAPDWIIEVISPSTSSHDYVLKLNLYKDAGVKEYWIVNPEEKSIVVCKFEPSQFVKYTFSDVVPVGILEGFSIDFSQLKFK